MGHVRLFEWSSGELVAEWSAWVEDRQTVVVDDRARVFWLSHALSGPYPQPAPVLPALMVATPSEPRKVFASVTDQPWDMSLVDDEIRARSADSAHRPIRIPLSGNEAGRVLPLERRRGLRRAILLPCRRRTGHPRVRRWCARMPGCSRR